MEDSRTLMTALSLERGCWGCGPTGAESGRGCPAAPPWPRRSLRAGVGQIQGKSHFTQHRTFYHRLIAHFDEHINSSYRALGELTNDLFKNRKLELLPICQ